MPRYRSPGGEASPVEAILDWFTREGRPLPWREREVSPWGVLVSEVMLQQTPVSRVLPAWNAWMARWPTPAALAVEPQAEAVRAWGRLGYPRRARRLWECAVAIERDFGGAVPSDEDLLRRLPGVGEYTAAAVAAFAYGKRTVVLDTNVRRVVARLALGVEAPASHLTRAERALAATLVPDDPETSVAWNVAAMELGALVCTSRSPRCGECPAAAACRWLAAGRPPAAASRRTAQPWEGSDRQIRGRILAVLRGAGAPVSVTGSAALADIEPGQLDRCLEGLLDDSLIVRASRQRGTYGL